jgi:hypothetical protein
VEEAARRDGIHGGARLSRGKGGGAVWKEGLMGGVDLSAAERKRKREEGRRAAVGEGSWAGGPTGLKWRKMRSFSFLFFSILFQNQTFQTVFKLFQTHLKLLKLQTFTQNTMQPKYNAQALVVSKFN